MRTNGLLLLCALSVLVVQFACSKKNDINAAEFFGSWRYTGSAGGFDSAVGPDLGDTLQFVQPDTVFYTYQGSTVWSNYFVQGNQLILVGSAGKDTLLIQSLDANRLQLIVWFPLHLDTAIYQKVTP